MASQTYPSGMSPHTKGSLVSLGLALFGLGTWYPVAMALGRAASSVKSAAPWLGVVAIAVAVFYGPAVAIGGWLFGTSYWRGRA